jgi:metal-responsive CopG/Arc/MetJ family transcriptional regulator
VNTITCKLPAKLDAELSAAAQEQGVSKSEVVRKALEDQIGRRRGKKTHRAFDLVGNLSGSLNGPADLLTNPKYMKDFGG